MPHAVRTIIETACVGCAGAIFAAHLSPVPAATLAGQEDLFLAIGAFGFCGAQIAVAVAAIALVGLPGRAGQ